MVQEIENVIEILEKAKKAIKQEDVITIKDLSNRTVHASSVYQDPDNINIAVILYSLSKIIERTHYRELEGWDKFEKIYTESIDNALVALKRKDIDAYRSQIERVRDGVDKLSGHLKEYIEEVFRKASINKASRLYEHGVSQEVAAKILGISQWELNQYVGNTGIADVNLAYTLDIKQRVKNAQDIFK
ncbi:MAG: hypothetical protein AABX17_02285 [Nanoarchaeota archaeon]|mgnify:CR=1 FL=1